MEWRTRPAGAASSRRFRDQRELRELSDPRFKVFDESKVAFEMSLRRPVGLVLVAPTTAEGVALRGIGAQHLERVEELLFAGIRDSAASVEHLRNRPNPVPDDG